MFSRRINNRTYNKRRDWLNNMKFNTDMCEINIIHEDVILKVSKNMTSSQNMDNLAELFKILGDSTRIKIISALLEEEMCVCDISALLDINRSTISHQLKTLRMSNIVKFRKDGKVVYYTIADSRVYDLILTGLIPNVKND